MLQAAWKSISRQALIELFFILGKTCSVTVYIPRLDIAYLHNPRCSSMMIAQVLFGQVTTTLMSLSKFDKPC